MITPPRFITPQPPKLPHESPPKKSTQTPCILQELYSEHHAKSEMYLPGPVVDALHLSSSSLILVTTMVVGVCAVLGIIIYRLVFHPLAGIPGPFLARCSTVWQNYHYLRGSWHDDIRILHEKYGPVVRISHYEVSFVDADALKRIYGHQNPCKKVVSSVSVLIIDELV
jgi:hypothetical protein